MSKNIYTLRDSDGRLMKFDGASWALQGSYIPNSGYYNWAGVANEYKLFGFFTFLGKMYVSWRSYYGGQPHLAIGVFNGTDIVPVTNVIHNPVSSAYTSHSNWINYKGSMYSVSRDREISHYVLYRFDGTTLSKRVLTEMSDIQVIQPEFTQPSSVIIFVHDDKIIISGRSTMSGPGHTVVVRNCIWKIDIDGDTVTSQNIPLVDGSNNVDYRAYSYSDSDETMHTVLNSSDVHNFSLNGKLYGINALGVCYQRSDDGLFTKTFKFDIRDAAIMSRGTVVTTAAGSASRIKFGSVNDFTPWYPFVGGAKVTWGAYVGNILYTESSIGASNNLRVRLLDGSPFPTVPSGETLTVTYGLAVGEVNTIISVWTQTYFSTEIIDGVAYICVTGRSPVYSAPDNNKASKTFIIRYDGVNAPTYFECAPSGVKPNIYAMATCVDVESKKIHLYTWDAYNQNNHHYIFNTLNSTWSDIGSFSTIESVSYYRQAITPGAIHAFNINEGDSLIESSVANASGTNITLTYKLFSSDSHAINIAVEYDIGSGFVSATEVGGGQGKTNLTSSPTGTTHTFIHNVGFDLPLRSGTIMYRITILP